MRPLSSDLREFIHLLNTNRVKYVIVGARSIAVRHACLQFQWRKSDSVRLIVHGKLDKERASPEKEG